jgi:thiamine-monophosphate kinase
MTSERSFTEGLGRFFAGSGPRPVVGIGDDGAIVRNFGGETVVVCDPVVEGVHFASDAPPRLIGEKAVGRNLSDLAAMGAVPDHLLASVLLPRGFSAARRAALFAGIRGAAAAAGCAVVGGDVAVTPGPLTVTVTALGHLPGRALLRSGARPGDTLHATGRLGGASLGRHLRVRARVAEGVWLANQPAVRAAIDISDGLLLDLWTLLRASGGLGARLLEAAVPIHADARVLSRRSGRTPLDHALGDGEDHELLFAVRAGDRLAAGGPLRASARRPFGVVLARPRLELEDRFGRRRPVSPRGYQHDLDGSGRRA